MEPRVSETKQREFATSIVERVYTILAEIEGEDHKAASHVIAGPVCCGLEVHSVDGVDVSVVFAVELLPITAVHAYRPQLIHLSQHHHPKPNSTVCNGFYHDSFLLPCL